MIYGAEGDPYTYVLAADGTPIGATGPDGKFKVIQPGSDADTAIRAQVESGQLSEKPDAVEVLEAIPGEMTADEAAAKGEERPDAPSPVEGGAQEAEAEPTGADAAPEKGPWDYHGKRDGIIARLMTVGPPEKMPGEVEPGDDAVADVAGVEGTPYLDHKLDEARRKRVGEGTDELAGDGEPPELDESPASAMKDEPKGRLAKQYKNKRGEK